MTESFAPWVLGWTALAAVIIVRHWHSGGVGLLFAYLLSFSTLHWLAPAFALLPWHEGDNPELTAEGLRQSTFALCAFAVGAELASRWFKSRFRFPVDETPAPAKAVPTPLTNAYLVSGIVMYAILTRFGSELSFCAPSDYIKIDDKSTSIPASRPNSLARWPS